MTKKIKILLVAFGLVFATSCDLDRLDNPNAVTLSSADNNFLLNRLALDFRNFFATASGFGMELTRMMHLANDRYEVSFTLTTGNGMWNNAYANILTDAEALIARADEANLPIHAGIARTYKAYTLMTMVDYFGDIPWSQALNPSEFNPGRDDDAAVYDVALATINAAIANFETPTTVSPGANELYYGSNAARWAKAAKSVKLKLLLNRRLIDAAGATSGINALIADAGGLINTLPEAFRFNYSRTTANPDSRHPRFVAYYTAGGGQYQSNYYMWHLTEAKKTGANTPGDASESPDPRARFYFYRQVNANSTDINEIRCIGEFPPAHYGAINAVFCYPGQKGYWGRDHLDRQGIPPDGFRRTAIGIYPVGGRFDANNPAPNTSPAVGNQGLGFQPIMMRSYVQFMLAEAALFLGTTGNPRTYLENGIRASMNDVWDWSVTGLEAALINTFFGNKAGYDTRVNAYVAQVLAEYDAATDNTGRMRVIAREYWIAAWQNGVEAYNLYRRTGQPDGMQPGLEANFGSFPRTLLYPSDHTVRNSNADQKASMDVQVFWDTNPAGFIN
jgi:hypothetical protein